MKIAILSLPFRFNYGHILQMYALQTILLKMGHTVTIIDKKVKFKIPWWRYPITILKRCFLKFVIRKNITIFQEQKSKREWRIMTQHITPFIKKNFPNRININNFNTDFNEKKFDAYIVGSDQVWNPGYFTFLFDTDINNAYLGFTKNWNVKRIAYAASFGKESWEYSDQQTVICKKNIQCFDAISVREDSAIKLCQKYFNVTASHVLDPTMLLTVQDYTNIIKNTQFDNIAYPYLLVYLLDENNEKIQLINKICYEKNIIPIKVNSKIEDPKAPLKEKIQPPIEYWINAYKNASFVFTDSFHGTVFSLIFQKSFLVYGNKKRGLARHESLLNSCNLGNRIINNINDFNTSSLDKIDYSYINKIIEKLRIESINFLKESLN